jgi:hypothetical protein
MVWVWRVRPKPSAATVRFATTSGAAVNGTSRVAQFRTAPQPRLPRGWREIDDWIADPSDGPPDAV